MGGQECPPPSNYAESVRARILRRVSASELFDSQSFEPETSNQEPGTRDFYFARGEGIFSTSSLNSVCANSTEAGIPFSRAITLRALMKFWSEMVIR